MRLRTIVPLLCGAMAVLAACSRDATGPSGAPGTLSFTYSGTRSGNFSATGFSPDVRTGTLWTTAWVNAGVVADNVGNTFVNITANVPSSGSSQVVQLIVPDQTGTFRLDSIGSIVVYDYLLNDSNGATFRFTPGTVTVTSVNASRMAGTFSGTATDSLNRTIVVSGGSFDVNLAP